MALYSADRQDETRARFEAALSGQTDFSGRDEAARLFEKIPPPRKKKAVALKPIDFDRIDQLSVDASQFFDPKSLSVELETLSGISKNRLSGGDTLKLDELMAPGLK